VAGGITGHTAAQKVRYRWISVRQVTFGSGQFRASHQDPSPSIWTCSVGAQEGKHFLLRTPVRSDSVVERTKEGASAPPTGGPKRGARALHLSPAQHAQVSIGHLLREQGVGSSNLPAPTNEFSGLRFCREHPGADTGAETKRLHARARPLFVSAFAARA